MNTSLPRSGRAWTVAAVLGMTALTTLGGPTSADAVPGSGSLPFAGGSPAPAGAYDFAAGIRTPGAARFFCTGSLVHPEWVLTAAHCVDDRPSVEVVVGETNLNDSVDPAETRSVDRIVINPRWGGDTGDKHDLAMVHLTTASTKTPITFGSTAAIDKAFRRCYQQRWSAAGPAAHALRVMPCRVGTGVALGWGRTPKSGGQTSSTLNQVNPKMYDLAPKTFWRVKAGACPGDSGGPLLVRQADGRLTQIGVASYAQHGGGWFDWLVGDRCSTKGWDFYADAAGTDPQMWMRRVIAPPPPVTNPGPPSCPNPTKPRCNGDELPQ